MSHRKEIDGDLLQHALDSTIRRMPYLSDTLEIDHGDEAKAQKMFELCEEFDWVPISMKNDWTTIYGDSVTHK